MDIVYRCYRCGKFVFQYQILYGSHGCKKCGSRKIEPLIENLTKFGYWLCNIRNKIGLWYYEKNKSKECGI